jgi:Flp pilus assembly protein TadB
MSEHDKKIKVINKAAPTGFIFFLAFIGAAIYFVAHSGGGFWAVILALLKAIVWPVFVMYHVLQGLGV